MSRLKTLFSAALLALLPTAVQAQDILNIVVGNLDVQYSGVTGEVSDITDASGGNLLTAEAFGLTSADIEVNRVIDTSLTSPPDTLFLDLLLTNLGSELTTDALISGAGGTGNPNAFGLDLFSTTAGLELRLGIDDISYVVVETAVPGADLFTFNAEATVLSQTIPNGRLFGPTVLISYTATDADLTLGQNGVSALTASGQLTITGTLVPEPSSLALIALGGALLARRRR